MDIKKLALEYSRIAKRLIDVHHKRYVYIDTCIAEKLPYPVLEMFVNTLKKELDSLENINKSDKKDDLEKVNNPI